MDEAIGYFNFKGKQRNKNFESAILDIQLRNIETYPDLELPTYAEVNSALPYLGIYDSYGNAYNKLPNRGNARFVDPDFYIRATDTRRSNIIKELENGQPAVYTVDSHGFEAIERGPAANAKTMAAPNVWFSDDTKAWIEENLSEITSSIPGEDNIDLMGTYNEFNKKILTDENAKKMSDYYHDDYSDYLYKARNSNIKSSVSGNLTWKQSNLIKLSAKGIDVVTDDNISEWFNIPLTESRASRSQIKAARSKISNPSQSEVHRLIYSCVKKYWPKLMDEYCQEEEIASGNKFLTTYLYGPTRISAPEITIEKILNTIKAVFEAESDWKQFVDSANGPIPRINSSNGNIGVSGVNVRSGILKNDSEIKRAIWDWRFNIEKGVEYFAWCYNKAIEDSNQDARDNPLDWAILFYFEGNRSRDPKISNKETLSNHQAYKNFRVLFEGKYGTDATWFYATPEKIVDETLVDQAQTKDLLLRLRDYLVLNGEKIENHDTYVKIQEIKSELGSDVPMNDFLLGNATSITLTADDVKKTKETMSYGGQTYEIVRNEKNQIVGGSNVKSTISTGGNKNSNSAYDYLSEKGKIVIIILDPSMQIDKGHENKAWFENKHNFSPIVDKYSPVEDLIHRHLLERFSKNSSIYDPFDPSTNFVVLKEGAYEEIQRVYNTTGLNLDGIMNNISWDKIYTLMNINDTQAVKDVGTKIMVGAAISLVVMQPDEISEMYRSGYRDLVEYDQRGRLLRAFPTFQMFLIDEGRWMTWHKLWDKFYGYNAILSIDVMKDRRIVADTAVIELSNLYHNLTTHDNTVSYGQFEYKVSDLLIGSPEDRAKVWKAIWDLPDAEIIRAYREELNSLILKPGARINLRMGYGSNAYALPVVFNGTITEMNAGEIVTVVAQGDGIELTNKITADVDETTDGGWLSATKEPRDMICEMLTSKGGYFKNLINRASKGIFFNSNPLGISHFGSPITPATLLIPNLFTVEEEDDYGDAGINVYCGAGYNTFSQWIYTTGEKRGKSIGMDWGGILWHNGDEPNVKIYLFDKTPWDVIQIYASIAPDYIATIIPFEYRSTLFYGKPWWGVIDKYVYQYRWDNGIDMFVKEPVNAFRKSLSQFRMYSSYEDIIANNIKATSDYMYTNVIGVYDKGGKKTLMVQADSDIYTYKQTTAIVDIPIKATKVTNYFTQAKYALSSATSALRDYTKEMYQGELTVLGDPSVKPYDTMYMLDSFTDMNGNAWVKRVVHHFSFETGFITNITPDCISIVDDRQGLSWVQWGASFAIGTMTYLTARRFAIYSVNKALGMIGADTIRKYGKNGVDVAMKKILLNKIDDPAVVKDLTKLEAKSIKEAVDLMQNSSFRSAIIGENIDEVIDILSRNGNKTLAASLKASKATATGFNSALKTLTQFIDEPAKLASKIDDFWDGAKSLGRSIEFFQKKGLVRKTVKGASTVVGGTLTASSKIATTGSLGLLKAGISVAKMPLVIQFIIPEIAFAIVTETVIEAWQRYLKSRQAVILMPLIYRGKEYTAGINGHRGCVFGDSPGKMDKFLEGSGYFGGLISTINEAIGVNVDYSTGEYDKEYIE